MTQDERPTTILPVLPLDDAVVLPGTSVTFPVVEGEDGEDGGRTLVLGHSGSPRGGTWGRGYFT